MKIELMDDHRLADNRSNEQETKLKCFQDPSNSLRKDVARLTKALNKNEAELEDMRQVQQVQKINSKIYADNEIEYLDTIHDLEGKMSRFTEIRRKLRREKRNLTSQLQTERQTSDQLRQQVENDLKVCRKSKMDLLNIKKNALKQIKTIRLDLNNVKCELKAHFIDSQSNQTSILYNKDDATLANCKVKFDIMLKSLLALIERTNMTSLANLDWNYDRQQEKFKFSNPKSNFDTKELISSAFSINDSKPLFSAASLNFELEYLRQETCTKQNRCKELESQLVERDDQIVALRLTIENMGKEKESRRSEIVRLMDEFLK